MHPWHFFIYIPKQIITVTKTKTIMQKRKMEINIDDSCTKKNKTTETILQSTEFLDEDRIEKLFYSGLLIDKFPKHYQEKQGLATNPVNMFVKSDYDQLLQMQKRADNKGDLRVSYRRAGDVGLVVAPNALTLGDLSPQLLGALAKDYYVQIRIVNLEYSIMQHLYKGNDGNLCGVASLFDTNTEFETMNTVCKYLRYPTAQLESPYDQQVNIALQQLDVSVPVDTTIVREAKGRLGKKEDEVGKLQRLMMQVYIEETLSKIYTVCLSGLGTDRFVLVPNSNAFLCSKELYNNEFLAECTQRVHKEFQGLELTFELRDFDTTYYDVIAQTPDPCLPLDCPAKWNLDYFLQLGDYPRMKLFFEQTVQKITSPSMILMISPVTIQGLHETPAYECAVMPNRALKDAFGDKPTLAPGTTGLMQVPFLGHWGKDKHQTQYSIAGFRPFGINNTDTTVSDVFNKFLGFPRFLHGSVDHPGLDKVKDHIQTFDEMVPNDTDRVEYRASAYKYIQNAPDILKPLLDIALAVMGDKLKSLDLLLAFIADALVRPEQKPGVSIVITGEQGCGKSMIIRDLCQVLGQYFMRTADPQFIWGTHATKLVDKIMVNLDEVNVGDTIEHVAKFKAMITEVEAKVNPKFVQESETRQYNRYISTTNQIVPIAFDSNSGDRRISIHKSSERCKDTTNWTYITRDFSKTEASKNALSDFFASYPLPENWKEFRVDTLTPYYDILVKSMIPIWARLMQYVIDRQGEIDNTGYIRNTRVNELRNLFKDEFDLKTCWPTDKMKKHWQACYIDTDKISAITSNVARWVDGKTEKGIVVDVEIVKAIHKLKFPELL
jgi:hypothetical protein